MDKAARSAQLARCVAHTGDVFTFAPGGAAEPVQWRANVAAEGSSGGDKRNLLIKTGRVQLTGPRSVFAGRVPEVGEDLTDADGNLYTIAEAPPEPTNPLLTLVCTVTPAAAD